jgi:First Longin domain of FUZ, MON1 and HPS1
MFFRESSSMMTVAADGCRKVGWTFGENYFTSTKADRHQNQNLISWLTVPCGRMSSQERDRHSPIQAHASSTQALPIDEDYFHPSQINTDITQRPASTDLPASLALPLSRTRSSTPNTDSPHSPLRAGPSTSVTDDSVSIRSFATNTPAGDDLEAMLSEMLGSDARWQMGHDDEVDVWEGESDDDVDFDSDTNDDVGDEGLFSLGSGLLLEDEMIRWRSRRKHFFVLSSAGKPIYARYGDDNIISGYMGVIQTIISFFEDNGDVLK